MVSVEPQLSYVNVADTDVDMVITGGESGHGARAFDLEWARDIVEACRRDHVACFVKQLGSNAWDAGKPFRTKQRAGKDPIEWPEELRVQQHGGEARR